MAKAHPALDPAAELARRRALAAERAKRYRAAKKRPASPYAFGGASVSSSSPAADSLAASPPVSSAPLRVLATQPMSALAGPPEAYAAVPPPVAGVDVPITPPSPADTASAARLAKVVGGLFMFTLADARARFGLDELVEQLGAQLGGGLDADAAAAAAVAFVTASTERAALKHGAGLPAIPYQDEIVAIAAAAGSVVYTAARIRGRLPEPAGAPTVAPASDTSAAAAESRVADADARKEPAPAVPSWMARAA